jgi:hypothetical protein
MQEGADNQALVQKLVQKSSHPTDAKSTVDASVPKKKKEPKIARPLPLIMPTTNSDYKPNKSCHCGFCDEFVRIARRKLNEWNGLAESARRIYETLADAENNGYYEALENIKDKETINEKNNDKKRKALPNKVVTQTLTRAQEILMAKKKHTGVHPPRTLRNMAKEAKKAKKAKKSLCILDTENLEIRSIYQLCESQFNTASTPELRENKWKNMTLGTFTHSPAD